MTASAATKRLRVPLAMGLAFVAGIFVFLAVFAVVRFFNPRAPQEMLPVEKRQAAALSFATLAGPRWSLAEHPGRVVIVNYFATWCGPCREEMPDLREVGKEFAGQGVELVFVSFDQDGDASGGGVGAYMKAIEGFAKSLKIDEPILIPPRDSPLFTVETPLPQTFLIDKHGRTAMAVTGAIGPDELRDALKKLLSEP